MVNEYIQRKKGLVTMENIHHRVFDESASFNTWKQVNEKYEEIDWTDDIYEEFLLTSKQLVEGGLERISETYFDLKKPDNVTVGKITAEFDQNLYEDSTDKEKAGFEYEVNDGVVHAQYIYTDVKTEISAAGQVNDLISENSISFRIDPDEELVIVESTYPPEIQKMKGVFRKETDFAAVVCGNLTESPEKANKQIRKFQDSFDEVNLDE